MGQIHKTWMLVVLVVVLSLYTSQAVEISWIGTYKWAAATTLGANITFNCVLQDNGTDVLPENATAMANTAQWQLVGDSTLRKDSYSVENKVVKGDQLLIMDVSEADKGIYMCRVDLQCSVVDGCDGKTEMWYKHGLNLNGPLYTDLLEKYTRNIITGSIAAASVTTIFALLCLVYKFRHKQPEEYDPDTELDTYTGNKMSAEIKTEL